MVGLPWCYGRVAERSECSQTGRYGMMLGMAKRSKGAPSLRHVNGRQQAMIGAALAVVTVAAVVAGLTYDSSRQADAASNYSPGYVIPTVALPSAQALPPRTPADRDADLQGIREIVASPNPITISVLGDSTGNNSDEWVALWAEELARFKTVRFHSWNEGKYADDVRQTGSGPTVDIWNGSKPGAAASYAVENLDALQPQKPDVVLLNFGHNQQPQTAGNELSKLMIAYERKWATPLPTAIVLQNVAVEPRAERSAANVNAIARMADERAIPTLDVFAAFTASPDIASLLAGDGTGVHPTPAGSRIWADVVIDQLNP